MRLNIGSGFAPVAGFINVDLCEGADLKHNLREPLPFDEGEIEEILAIHVIESFYRWEFPAILRDWHRVLRSSGKLTIEFTELTATINLYLNGESQQSRTWGKWGIYGDQSKPVDPIIVHHYDYERDELEQLLKECGFANISFTKKNILHIPARDWRVICFVA